MFAVVTLALAQGGPSLPPVVVALAYLLIVFGASARGGRALGLALAALMATTFAYRFAAPYDSIAMDRPIDQLTFIAFIATAIVVSTLVAGSAARVPAGRLPDTFEGPPRLRLRLDPPADAARNRRRRVVILTEDSKPALGGIAEYLHQLATALSATHDVLIVSCIPGADLVDGGPHVRYRELRWFRTQRRMRGDRWMPARRANTLAWRFLMHRYVRTTLASIAADYPDSTFVIGRMSVVTHPWCVACRALSLPYVAFAYGLELIDTVPRRSVADRRVDVAGAEHWFPISADTRELLDQFGVSRDRQTLLSPGVDPRSVAAPEPADRRAVRDRLGLGDHQFVLTLCHLRARKGVDLSLRAFATIADEFPDVRYVVAGVGPEYDALVALSHSLGLAHRVIFAGRVDDRTRNALLAECTAFVMANRRFARDVEGFGIVFLEAALHGKPSIGGRNGGVPDAVEDGVTGLLADTDTTPDDVARAMRQILADPDRAACMGSAARARAIRGFAWGDRAVTFARTIDELARRGADDAPRIIMEPRLPVG